MKGASFFRALALVTIGSSLATSLGCDEPACEEEILTVDENGTCATSPQRFELRSFACRLSLEAPFAMTGLPQRGAIGPEAAPVRQGGFLLYQDGPPFRLCRARRVDYRLELSCEDDQGAPVCEAVLTERP